MCIACTDTFRARIAFTGSNRVQILLQLPLGNALLTQVLLGCVFLLPVYFSCRCRWGLYICNRCVILLQVPLRSIFLADVIISYISIARTNRQCAYVAGAIVDCNSFTYVTMKIGLTFIYL